MNENNNHDPNKKDEEELIKLLEELKKQQQKKPKHFSVSLGFMLHRNYLVHLTLSYAINLILFAVLIGFSGSINQPFMDVKLEGLFIGITLFTLLENFIKILLFKYFTRFMILTLGLFSVTIQMIVLAITDSFVEPGFEFQGVEHLIIFAFIFSMLRLIFSSYLRRILYGERLIFMGGKK